MIDRATAPTLQSITEVPIPSFSNKILANQLPFHYLNAGVQPIFYLEILYRAGSWHHDTAGFTGIMIQALKQGTNDYSAEQIQQKFDLLGGFLEILPGTRHSSVRIIGLTSKLDELLALLADLLLNSAFPEEELNLCKRLEIEQYLQNKKKTNFIAAETFRSQLFGGSHPYGRTIDTEIILKIDRNQLINQYEQLFKGNWEGIAVGKLTAHHLNRIVSFLEQLPYHTLGSEQKYQMNTKPGANHKHMEDAKQVSLSMGQLLISKQHPDHLPLSVAIVALGGYFGSRLMQNIRQRKGYTYGIYSIYGLLHEAGYLSIQADIKPDCLEDCVREIKKEIVTLQKQPMNQEELERVKSYMVGQFIGKWHAPGDLINQFKSLYLNGMDESYAKAYISSIQSLTSSNIQQAAARHIHIDQFVEVSVGKIS